MPVTNLPWNVERNERGEELPEIHRSIHQTRLILIRNQAEVSGLRGIGAWRSVNGSKDRPWWSIGFTWVPTQPLSLGGLGYSVFEFGARFGGPSAVADESFQG
jgi:hypothetical protein